MNGAFGIRTLLVLLLSIAFGALVLFWAMAHLSIETDLTKALPADDIVLADASYIFKHHPQIETIAIDFRFGETGGKKLSTLIEAAEFAKMKMKASGLFSSVGLDNGEQGFLTILKQLPHHLPSLFSEEEIRHEILPKLQPEAVLKRLRENKTALLGLGGIGRGAFLQLDPLGFHEIALAKLSLLMPTNEASLQDGHIVHERKKRVLLLAQAKTAAANMEASRGIHRLFLSIESELKARYGDALRMTPVGGYRAALDNERLIRADVQRLLLIVTLGIALLLILTFRRPWFGLLALLPALVSTALAIGLYTFFFSSISAIAIGFGGAIISISVDHAIQFLRFLDADKKTSGKEAAQATWAIGLPAAATSVLAFFLLSFSGFEILGQVGVFAAMGIGLSFLYVHLIFPFAFGIVTPRRKGGNVSHLERAANALTRFKMPVWVLGVFAFLIACVYLFFQPPRFQASLEAANSVTKATLQAEKMIEESWGGFGGREYLYIEAANLETFQEKSDQALLLLQKAKGDGAIVEGFSPSLLCPGEKAAEENRQAWKKAFSEKHVDSLKKRLRMAALEAGFQESLFARYFQAFDEPKARPLLLTEAMLPLFSIQESEHRHSALFPIHFTESKAAADFADAFRHAGFKLYQPKAFADALSGALFFAFTRLLAYVGLAVFLILLLLLADLRLVLLALTPVLFALVMSLSSLSALGHPVGLAGLMLAILVVGGGIDYGLFLVGASQRFGNDKRKKWPAHVAVFLAGASTLIGMGAMRFADHGLLQSAGLSISLGIGYSLVGAFVILSPILDKLFTDRPWPETDALALDVTHALKRYNRRYRFLPAYPRIFSKMKRKLDPMFGAYEAWLPKEGVIIDAGAGLGAPLVWALSIFPKLKAFAIEPDARKAGVLQSVIRGRGEVVAASLPLSAAQSAAFHAKADALLFLDVAQYLSDEALAQSLHDFHQWLKPDGRLIARATISAQRKNLPRRMEELKARVNGDTLSFRNSSHLEDAIQKAGFSIETIRQDAKGREETWFIARKEG